MKPYRGVRKVKVFAMLKMCENLKQVRHVLAVRTQKEAAVLFGVSMYHFARFASETGNKKEIEAAMKMPGIVVRMDE